MKTSFKPLKALLGENNEMAHIVTKHRMLSRLQHSFADILPADWASHCRVAALEDSTVIIAAANGAIATNLKAYSPKLLAEFKAVLKKKTAQEQEVTGIRIMVQPEISTWRPPTPTSIRLAAKKSVISQAQLADLSEQLADSPLKKVIEKMRAKQAKATMQPDDAKNAKQKEPR